MDSEQTGHGLDRFAGRVEDLLWSPCISCERKLHGPVCEAFPVKIPDDILRDTINVERAYPGDHCPAYQATPGSEWFELQQREGPRWEPRQAPACAANSDRPPRRLDLDPLVVCADVGSVPNGKFGWWAGHDAQGSLPSDLVAWLTRALNDGLPVALGFECPLFVPLRDDEQRLTRAREGEGSYPFSAGAGAGALVTGLVEVAWVLSETRRQLHSGVAAYLDWQRFVQARSGLFLWEAFVTGAAKKGGHVEDAQAGAEAMTASLPNPPGANAVHCPSPAYSLIGAALLRTGWSRSLSLLHEPCLVIKA